MRISFVSINSITNIPSIRFIVKYFQEKGDFISICETHYLDSNSYFKESNNLKLEYYKVFKNYDDSLNSNKRNFLIKYFKLALVVLKQIRSSECIYTNDYQILFLLFMFKKVNKKPMEIVYHQFEVILESKLNKINKFLFAFVKRNINQLSLAILPEKNRLKYFVSQTNYKGEIGLIPNSCRLSDVKLDVRKVPVKKTVLHVGSVGGSNHYFDSILKVMEILKDEPIDFVFVGRHSPVIKKKFESLNLPNLILHESVPHQKLKDYYRMADMGLILYKSTGVNYEFCAPNKLYEMWSHGLPVLGHTLVGLNNVFKYSFQGELVSFDKVDELAKLILAYNPDNDLKNKLLGYFENNLEIDFFLPLLDKIKK